MGAEDLQDLKLKPMKCELNFLSKSDGSAILSQGDTVVLASVNGPLDIKTTSQSIEKATLEVLFCTKEGKPSVADRYKENVIRQTCETAILGCLYPRTGINLTIQELENYGGAFKRKILAYMESSECNIALKDRETLGSDRDMIEETGRIFNTKFFPTNVKELLSCAVNCSCLALINSGVAMRHVVAALCCAVDETGNLVLEPTHQQAQNATAKLYFVFDSRDKNLVTGFTEGSFSEGTYEEALERCRVASDLVFEFYRDIVEKYSKVI